MALFEAQFTTRTFARKINVHETQVSRWRHGLHIPEPETQRKIAAALDREVDELWPKLERSAA